MAEYMLRDRLGEGSIWTVSSAGAMASVGSPASSLGVHAMAEMGIDMQKHRSMPLTKELVDLASVIVVMTETHADQIRYWFPEAKQKIFLLKSFDENAVDKDVVDPIGTTIEVYRSVRDDISEAIPGLEAFLQELG